MNQGGFDALVGNPPFIGGKRIKGALGQSYRDYLVEYIAGGQRGSADYVAYFFLRAQDLLKSHGTAGLLATNTIAQGDTREVALDQITARGTSIYRAIPSRKWPGEASLEVAHVWFRKGQWRGQYVLDDSVVPGITSQLQSPGRVSGRPHRLLADGATSYIGSFVLGMGFVLEPEQAESLIEKDARNREVLFPFLNGEDLNGRWDQSPSRWAINFRDWPLEKAMTYADCFEIVERLVKPERTRKAENGEFQLRYPLYERWWQYADKRPELYAKIATLQKVLVVAATSRTLAFCQAPPTFVYSHATCVFAMPDAAQFALLQSTVHDSWARQHCSSMKGDLRYTPSDGFETFPFPLSLGPLEVIGGIYHACRRDIMANRQEGLTSTYNRLHAPEEVSPDIAKLRELQVEMDYAVARSYGWAELDLGHDFHSAKQGIRYTISETARREILDRLLSLNHERHAEEQVLVEAARPKRKKAKRTVSNPELF